MNLFTAHSFKNGRGWTRTYMKSMLKNKQSTFITPKNIICHGDIHPNIFKILWWHHLQREIVWRQYPYSHAININMRPQYLNIMINIHGDFNCPLRNSNLNSLEGAGEAWSPEIHRFILNWMMSLLCCLMGFLKITAKPCIITFMLQSHWKQYS